MEGNLKMRKVFIEELPKREKGVHKGKTNWKNSVGYEVKGIYDDISFKVKIIDYYKKKNKAYLKLKYKNKNYDIRTDDFSKCNIQKVLHDDLFSYIYNIGDVVANRHSGKLQILEQIKMFNGENIVKGYKYRCLICNNEDTIRENDLKYKKGCNVCAGKKVLKGYNDMWTTNHELAKLLADPNDGYKYTQNSHQKLDWKCPDCGNIIKDKQIKMIKTYKLSCPKCSDGISYPEKCMYGILEQLQIKFQTQLSKVTFKWCDKYKYDFYFKLNDEKYIIETHGLGHYEESFNTCGGRTLEEEQENDRLKKELAIKNGIKKENYIVIDCRESELEWIKDHILSSRLNKLFDLKNIDWIKVGELACSSFIKKACELWNSGIHSTMEISNIMNIHIETINRYLKRGVKIKICDYDPKLINKIKVICLNHNKVFKSIAEAQKYYNMKGSNSTVNCCKNKESHSGKDPKTGEYLQWQYYDEYLVKPKKLLSNDEIDNVYRSRKAVICLNNNKIFNSLTEASKYCNIKCEGNISLCCQGKQKSSGKDSITGESLHWMYYDKYLIKYKDSLTN